MFARLQELYSLLTEKMLTEMAFDRKKAIEKVSSLNLQLADHMVLIEQCGKSSSRDHWKVETNAFLNTIWRSCRLKNRNWLKRSDLLEPLWEGPLGEYGDYLATIESLKNAKPNLDMGDPNKEHYAEIKRKYVKLLDLLSARILPKYDDL